MSMQVLATLFSSWVALEEFLILGLGFLLSNPSWEVSLAGLL